jgi:hypothetical protein
MMEEDTPAQIKFYTDAHIPKSVIEQARLHGVDIVRCEDVGMKQASDEEHLEYALREGRVMVTADEDFLRLDATWRQAGKTHAGIVYIYPERQGVVGAIVREIVFLHQAVAAGAATPEEMHNDIWRVKG